MTKKEKRLRDILSFQRAVSERAAVKRNKKRFDLAGKKAFAQENPTTKAEYVIRIRDRHLLQLAVDEIDSGVISNLRGRRRGDRFAYYMELSNNPDLLASLIKKRPRVLAKLEAMGIPISG